MNSIQVYQKNWAFTKADSEKPIIKTGTFGPCYVVTFAKDDWAALTHIDDTTQVESMQGIVDRIKMVSRNLNDVNVIVLGGWEDHPESNKWGSKVVTFLKEAGFKNLNLKHIFKKHAIEDQRLLTTKNVNNHYFLGLQVDARTGKSYFLKEIDKQAQQEQARQIFSYYQEHGIEESPLTEVFD